MPLSPVTIVIPVYNRASTLPRTLASIDAQTLSPAAVIIVDNGSTDASLSISHQWASSRPNVSVVSESHPGACAARNRGLALVTTPWTMFFDSDDVMLPNHIADFTRAIENNPRADIIGRDMLYKTLDGKSRRLFFRAGRNAMFHHLFRGSLATQRYVARTDLFRRVGGWDETLVGWNDYELGVRLLLENPVMVELPGSPSVVAYAQTESITGTRFSDHPDRWESSLATIRQRLLSKDAACRVSATSRISVESGREDALETRHAASLQTDRVYNSDIRRYLDWLDARAMILAATYARESRDAACRVSNASEPQYATPASTRHATSRQLSERLYREVMARTVHPRIMELIYRHQLLFGRLAWPLARILL